MMRKTLLSALSIAFVAMGLHAQRGPAKPDRSDSSRIVSPRPPSRDITPPTTSNRPIRSTRPDTQAANPSLPSYPRPRAVPPPSSDRILVPRATPRCQPWPDSNFWKTRDIFQEIQYMARRGFIPVTPGGDATQISGASFFPAGWRAYGFVVPAGEKLHVRLHHPNEGWFRLAMADRWGQTRKQGMLQNLIPTGNPEVTYNSPLQVPTTVYVIVDDPGWMSSEANPFTLDVDRSWDPAKKQAPALPPVLGIWALAEKPAPAPAQEGASPAKG